MIAMRQTSAELARNGLYIVVAGNGDLRALVDEQLAGAMPSMRATIEAIGEALADCLPRGLAISVKLEPGPRSRS